jgi:hypothetical protein
MNRSAASRLVRAWLLTAVIDGSFSGILAQFFYGSTAKRLFQGVAATLLGPDAVNGGTRTALIGLAMHFGVALGWSTVFLLIFSASARVREIVASRGGALKVAAVYGPCIWMVMSLAVIPMLTHRPPAIMYRWWIQFFGHVPFVALPMVAMIGGEARTAREAASL